MASFGPMTKPMAIYYGKLSFRLLLLPLPVPMRLTGSSTLYCPAGVPNLVQRAEIVMWLLLCGLVFKKFGLISYARLGGVCFSFSVIFHFRKEIKTTLY